MIGKGLEPSYNVNKTALVVVPKNTEDGTLVSLLRSFSERGLSIYSIHSRPLKSELGKYCFILTVEGHVGDPLLISAIHELINGKATLKILGSFPPCEAEMPLAPFKHLNGSLNNISEFNQVVEKIRSSN